MQGYWFTDTELKISFYIVSTPKLKAQCKDAEGDKFLGYPSWLLGELSHELWLRFNAGIIKIEKEKPGVKKKVEEVQEETEREETSSDINVS